jgi:hypothetical protein
MELRKEGGREGGRKEGRKDDRRQELAVWEPVITMEGLFQVDRLVPDGIFTG